MKRLPPHNQKKMASREERFMMLFSVVMAIAGLWLAYECTR